MKHSVILIILIALFHIASAQNPSSKVQTEHAQSMLRIQRETVAPSVRGLMEIHEYTHPLLKKYLPDYIFYIPYIPPYKGRSVDRDGKEKEVPVGEWYLSCLGIVDRKNRLSLFDNLQVGKLNFARAFLKTASIKRSASSRTDNELREIASMFLILSSLKGLNGYGFIEVNPMGLPTFSLHTCLQALCLQQRLSGLDCRKSFETNNSPNICTN